MESAAWVAIAVLSALSAFQLSLSAGAPLGRLAWGGKHRTLPRGLRVASALSIVLYAGCAAVIADAARLADLFGGTWSRTAVAVLVGYFALGVVVNAVSRSRPEQMVMTPVAVVLVLATSVVASRA